MMLRGMMWHCGNNRVTWGSLDYSYLCGTFHSAPPTCGRQSHVHYRSNLATETHMLTESAGTNYVMVLCTQMYTCFRTYRSMLRALNDLFFLLHRSGRLYLLMKCIPFIVVVTHIRVALEISEWKTLN